MNKRTIVAATSVAALMLVAVVASARNMHCAGGVQYVTQAIKDKERGNLEDYSREMNKAVDQLNLCASEDPADLEAIGYLGWAYAELDSAGPAGLAFQKSIDGLSAKGNKKALDIVSTNRESYWARAYNDGIKKIGDAQVAWPEYTKVPSADEKTLKDEATKLYDAAIVSLTRAKLLKLSRHARDHAQPGDGLRAHGPLRRGRDRAQERPDRGRSRHGRGHAAHRCAQDRAREQGRRAARRQEVRRGDHLLPGTDQARAQQPGPLHGPGQRVVQSRRDQAGRGQARGVQERRRRLRQGVRAEARRAPTWASMPRWPTRTRASWRWPKRSGAPC